MVLGKREEQAGRSRAITVAVVEAAGVVEAVVVEDAAEVEWFSEAGQEAAEAKTRRADGTI